MPIARFSAIAWLCDDAAANLHRIAAYVAQWVGPASIEPEYNTDVCRRRAGTTALQLISWPPERQSHGLSNDADDREPRLRTAVRLTAITGFRLLLTAHDDAWVRAFRSVATVAPQRTVAQDRIADTAPGETELEYARAPGSNLARTADRIGYPLALAALIFCTLQLFVVPRKDVLGFSVTRMRRAKGARRIVSTRSVRDPMSRRARQAVVLDSVVRSGRRYRNR